MGKCSPVMLTGLKVPQLKHSVEARGVGVELLERGEFRRREGKILLPLVGREARPLAASHFPGAMCSAKQDNPC